MDGASYLRARIDDLNTWAATGGQITSIHRAEIHGMAQAFTVSGVLDAAEAEAIVAGLGPSPDATTLKVSTPVHASDPLPEARRASRESATPTDGGAAPDALDTTRKMPELLYLVSPTATAGADQQPGVLPIAIEVWTTMIRIHLAHPSATGQSPADRSQASRELVLQHRRWTASDDRDGHYVEETAHWSEASRMLLETRALRPGPTPGATTIRFRTGNPVLDEALVLHPR